MLGRRRGGRWVQKFTAQGCVASLSKQTSKRETRDKIATYDWTERARKETGKSRSRKTKSKTGIKVKPVTVTSLVT